MSTANNHITHHTSHTLENGASSSNKGAYGDGEHSSSNECGRNQGRILEPSLMTAVLNLTRPTQDSTWYGPDELDQGTGTDASSPYSFDDSSSPEGDNFEGETTTAATSVYSASSPFRFSIIDSTLREGEQFTIAHFDTAQKIRIAQALDDFGVEYIEVTSPATSPQSRADYEAICKLNLRAKILCHIRCDMGDARIAIQTGVDGINMCIGTSSQLMTHSHGKDMAYIAAKAKEVIAYVRSNNIEVRFSGEDSFRSEFADILELYSLVDRLGADRVGIADTVGGATPREVFDKVDALRRVVSCDIETHFHNDTGCAIANAYVALEAGATHIDTTVLGIGERNGITPLGGLIASLLPTARDYILSKYKIETLTYIEHLVSQIVEVDIPFNNFVLSF